jgi:tRNA(Ile)-lysidine synthase
MVSVHALAQSLLTHIRREELLRAGDRVGIAVSGGVDSVALLRLLLELRRELGIVISVVHFNHKLRGAESDADQEFVARLAHEHGLELHVESGDVAELAAEEHSGVEAAARELRYGFFQSLLEPENDFGPGSPAVPRLNKIATGHTLDDQAETVLMRLIRGTGMRGLGGIYPRIVVGNEDGEEHGEIVRPLLGVRRHGLQQYLADLRQPWREDSTNTDSKFTRNRLRKLVLPILEREFNPAVVESVAELAEIARDEEDYWENEISGWLGTVVQWSEPQPLVQIQTLGSEPEPNVPAKIEEAGVTPVNASVSRPWLLTEPKAVQRRVLKAIGEQAGIPLEFKHVEEILRFAAEHGPSGKELSIPLGWKILRESEAMVFVAPAASQSQNVPDYEYPLLVPGRALIPELGTIIEALLFAPEAQIAEYNSEQLLRADLLPRRLIVRNWRPGDRFWPAHTKAPKKVKELLQERHVAQPERKLWPLVASGDEILWMRGFPIPASLYAKEGQEAVLIREVPGVVGDDAI